MTDQSAPSNILAVLATTIFELEKTVDPERFAEWMTATDDLRDEAETPYWTMGAADLLATPAISLFVGTSPAISDAEDFLRVVRALQALDAWHAPLFPRAGENLNRLEAHEHALDRRLVEGCLGEDAHGYLIPARLWDREIFDLHGGFEGGTDPYDQGSAPSALRQLLSRTAYVPKRLPVECANNQGLMTGRSVAIRYRVHESTHTRSRGLFDPIRVGVAPLVEARNEAKFEFEDGCYAISPQYPFARLERVVADALANNVELLLFPEMSVREADLEGLGALIRDTWMRLGENSGETPKLRYVIAGATGPRGASGRHRNFVVMFDHFGREVMRQDKLHRWNLEPLHLERYGLDTEFGLTGLIEEDIDPASEVTLLDVPDLGRLVHLICADVNFNSPGDWLLQHCGTDWLHAPIMDQSTKIVPLGPNAQWILKRALRAASLGHGRVMVTNSMAITHRANDTNQLNARPAYVVADVTLGFLLDAMGEQLLYHRLAADCTAHGDVLEVVDWNNGWGEFPKT